ncbi:hypothetical protein DMH04_23165 [Kibdelosporangium aridum]|uniref:Uncharacterized protein n=1 Tax=Kibdelosporangium aridum TaxID=2030 RepID=A0A428Z7C5_KIBAR|nr:hypothetical protein [Kibdelosporangium aridum]RSM83546.1 hypothetical protein DMH04_23165 [Kibdelosporangium aridum]
MERLGYWLKSSAVVIGLINCVLLGEQLASPSDPFWPVIIVSAAVVPTLLFFGYKHTGPVPSVKEQIRTHLGVREYTPLPGEGWLPHKAWRQFPDPLPETPTIRVSFWDDIPAGDVPPDAILRRLWLVRAQIVADYNPRRAFSRFERRSPLPTIKLTTVWIMGVGMFATEGVHGDEWGARLAGLFVALFVTGPIIVGGKAFLDQVRVIRRRKKALRAEEQRLMDLDSQRPGGPLGGESVFKQRTYPKYSGPSYIPPPIPSGSLA